MEPQTDIILDSEDITIDALGVRLHLLATDVTLTAPHHTTGDNPLRRAFVHSEQDELVLNFGQDYPGGVRVHGRLLVGRLESGPADPSSAVAAYWKPSKAGLPDNPVNAQGAGGVSWHDFDPDYVFEQLDHPAPLDLELELNVLRSAVVRLLRRVEHLESTP